MLVLALLAATAFPAHAHRLKVFATVEDGAVSGYAFFIGGGRPSAVAVIIRNGSGEELHRGTTDEQGRFSWRPSQPGDLTITVDTRDGHAAEAAIPAGRFAGAGAEAGPTPARSGDAEPANDVVAPSATPARPGTGRTAPDDDTALASLVERAVDRAVARQVRPLLESFEAAEGRIRFNDIAGGVGMIVGLAGLALWAASRRRDKRSPPGGVD